MKNKKFLKAIAAITLSASAALGAFGLAACGHTHDYQWENSDPNQHWKVCAEDGEEQEGTRADHDFTNGDCICGRPKPTTPGGGEDNPNPNPGGGEDNPNPGPGGGEDNPGGDEDPDADLSAGLKAFIGDGTGVIYKNGFKTGTVTYGDGKGVPAGVYGNVSSATEFSESNKVEIVEGKLKLTDSSSATTNAYIRVETVTLKKVHIYATVVPGAKAGGWDLLRIIDGNGVTIAAVRTGSSGDSVGVYIGSNNALLATAPDLKCVADTAMSIEATLDLGTGAISVKLAGKDVPLTEEHKITATDFGGVMIMTAGSASRNTALDEIGIKTEASEVTPDTLKTEYDAKLDAYYAQLTAVEGTYTEENATALQTKYEAGVAAIAAAETSEAVLEAYDAAIVELDSVETIAATALREAKEAACTEIDGYKTASEYTLNGEALTNAVAAAKTAINNQKTTDAVTSTLAAEKAKIDEIKSDAQELAAAKTVAITELDNYKEASDYTYDSNKAAYNQAITDGEAAINGVTIGEAGAQAALDEVQTKLTEAKAALDQVPTNDQVKATTTLKEDKDAAIHSLAAYAEDKKAEYPDDTTIANAIDAAVTAGNAKINGVAGDDSSQDETLKAEVEAKLTEAEADVDKAVTDIINQEFTITASGVEGVTIPNVKYGGTIVKPEAPKQDGKLFDGWYTAETGGEAVDFNAKIYANTTIYAHFVDIPTYESFQAKNNIVLFDDFSAYDENEKLPAYTATSTLGVYDGTDSAISGTNYVHIVNGIATQVDPGSGMAQTIVDIGNVTGVIEGYFEVTFADINNSWTPVQFIGNGKTKVGAEIFGLRTADGHLKYRIEGGSTYKDGETAVTSANGKHSIYFKLNTATGALTMAYDGKVYVTELDLGMTALTQIKFVSSNSGSRLVHLDNLFISGDVEDLDAYKNTLTEKLTAAIGDLTSEGITQAQTGLANATTTSEAFSSYYVGLIMVKQAAEAKALADAKQVALDEIETTYPATNYTQEGNQSLYNAELDKVKNATTIEEVAAAKAEALDNIANNILTNEQLNSARTVSIVLSDTTNAHISVASITVENNGTTTEEYVTGLITLEEHYKIVDCFADAGHATPFDFDAPITADTTIYVQIAALQKVSLTGDEGVTVNTADIYVDGVLNEKNITDVITIASGKEVAGYYTDSTKATPVTLPLTLTSDTTIYIETQEKTEATVYSVDAGTLGVESNEVFTLTKSFNEGSAGWKGTINGEEKSFTKAIRAGGDSGRNIKFNVKAGTKISIACGGNYGTKSATGDIWLGTAGSTTKENSLASITATNDSGAKTSSSLLEYTATADGDIYIILGANKPSIYAILLL